MTSQSNDVAQTALDELYAQAYETGEPLVYKGHVHYVTGVEPFQGALKWTVEFVNNNPP